MNKDKTILRNLAQRYAKICANPVQNIRRDLWRKHNSLKETSPLIYVRAFAWPEMPESKCVCKDQLFRQCEDFFRCQLFWDSLNDDSVFEPWVTVQAVYRWTGWGVAIDRHYSGKEGGSYKIDYPLKTFLMFGIEAMKQAAGDGPRSPLHGRTEAERHPERGHGFTIGGNHQGLAVQGRVGENIP